MTRALGCVAFLLMLLAEFAAHGEKAGSPNPPAPQALEKAIQRGREFLIKNQNKDGSWGTAQKTKGLNIFAPVPGAHHAFRSAVTAMCIAALIETGAADQDTQAKQALERGEAWLLKNLPHLRRADAVAIYNVWGHAYGIHALANMYRRASPEPARQQQIKEEILAQIDLLRRYESVDGGWGYYDFRAGTKRPASDSTSFVTATVLVAFHAVKKNGIEIPEDPVRRGVASINRQRKNDNTYAYDQALRMRPMMGINRPGGSLGRSQACNLALRLWGDKTITDQVITHWLDRLVARNDWLSFGRKRPVPHESWFMVAGYFFYYGHYYAALGLEQLNVAQARPYQDRLAGILLPLQEKDGSWWDYPLYNYHQQYGTAFALMSLARCRQQAP
ncbi:MAG: terpene cyclase/mutase family protein [Chloroflexi bacterium]|nr:terpene cyclase/mutase family protein [Chloroflexota bacterium]